MTSLSLEPAAAEAPSLPDAALRRVLAAAADHLALGKPRIVLLLLVTGFCSMVVAARGLPAWHLVLWTMVGLALSAGGANAINMWYDRDIDPLMTRTALRPVAAGRLPARRALALGVLCQAVSLPVLVLGVNWPAALLTLSGALFYVFIYTMWLKRRSPQNIVIGGGAGAFPPLVGWAAVTGGVGAAAVLMFLVVFLWTPPHFWALALYRQDDYRRARIPMMPVARGERTTKRQILVYAGLLLAASAALYRTHTVGWVFLLAAGCLGLGFVACAWALLRERLPEVMWAKRTFRYSLLYLALLFATMVLDVRPF